MRLKTIQDVPLAGQRTVVRVDFNVPLAADGSIADDRRIQAALPTIRYLVQHKAKVILISHLGRPKGNPDGHYSLAKVAQRLAATLSQPVVFVQDVLKAHAAIEALPKGGVLLLENIRFYPQEVAGESQFAQRLAEYADIYVNDAFGTAHRAHASTTMIGQYVPIKVAGLLMQKELSYLGQVLGMPKRPFVVILGGAKVSDKLGVIEALLKKADTLLITGAMAYTFLLAQGKSVGSSRVEMDQVQAACSVLQKAQDLGKALVLPIDHVVTDVLNMPERRLGRVQRVECIPDGYMGVDIGPKTVALFGQHISAAKTVFWNGPAGVFEIEQASSGTFAIARALAENIHAVTIVGGGDSAKAVYDSGYADKVTFMSTGGGASLEYLEGKELPGVQILEQCSV